MMIIMIIIIIIIIIVISNNSNKINNKNSSNKNSNKKIILINNNNIIIIYNYLFNFFNISNYYFRLLNSQELFAVMKLLKEFIIMKIYLYNWKIIAEKNIIYQIYVYLIILI